MLLRIFFICLLIFPLTAQASPPVVTDYGSVAELLAEINQLKNDIKDADEKIEMNIALIKTEQEKWEEINEEVNKKSENVVALAAKIEEEKPEMQQKCHDTYPEEEYDAAEQACNDVLGPYNDKVAAHNDDLKWLQENASPITDTIERLTQENSALKQEKFQATRQIHALKKLIPVVAQRECTAQCNDTGKQDDTVAQCLQHCMDGAQKAENLPYVGDAPPDSGKVVTPDWKNSGKRTAEEAIEEYKKGSRPGKNTLRTKEPPLPGARQEK
ncbi:MAG: hypothetical protein EP349_00080 [Alphaproteobacteria bacterium]|nr:MAG: hypothetical protein EP349_00080 [Alphaproteobacteria bacterium]